MLKKMLFVFSLSISSLFAIQVGDSLDSFTIKELKMFQSKVYIVNFFASWCSSCKVELPLISKLNTQIDKQKYQIIGINSDTNINKGKKFVKELNLNFDVIYDYKLKLISKFNPIGVPAIYYIKDLKVEKMIYGAVQNVDKEILNDLKQLGE